MAYQLTKKQMMKEIVRCGKDPDYFINSFITISHPIKGTIPFNTFDYQTGLLESYQDYRFNCDHAVAILSSGCSQQIRKKVWRNFALILRYLLHCF